MPQFLCLWKHQWLQINSPKNQHYSLLGGLRVWTKYEDSFLERCLQTLNPSGVQVLVFRIFLILAWMFRIEYLNLTYRMLYTYTFGSKYGSPLKISFLGTPEVSEKQYPEKEERGKKTLLKKRRIYWPTKLLWVRSCFRIIIALVIRYGSEFCFKTVW